MGTTTAHAGVLTDTEAAFWRTVRAARPQAHGDRTQTIHLVARRTGMDTDTVASEMDRIKAKLTEAGAQQKWRHFTTLTPDGRCAPLTVVDGSAAHQALTDVQEHESARFAHNAAAAANIANALSPRGIAELTAAVDIAIDSDIDLTLNGETDGRQWTAGRRGDSVGIFVGRTERWAGNPGQARWVNDTIRATTGLLTNA